MSNLSPEITQTPAVLTFNYETFKADLELQLEDYRTVVTLETVKAAKETATELNAMKTFLDTQRKDAIKYVSAPIKLADDQMKECVGLVAAGRQEILDQVARFDQVRLDDLRTDLTGRRDRLRADAEIQAEFFAAASDISDLVKLGSLTTTNRATNKAVQAVADRVNAELQLQQNVERRLLKLTAASYEAGLSSPLERTHVEHFLKADEDTYTANLQNLVAVEVERQEQAEAKIRQTVEREHQNALRAEEQRQERKAQQDAEQQRLVQKRQEQIHYDQMAEQQRHEQLSIDAAPAYELEPSPADDAYPDHGGYAVPEPAPAPEAQAPQSQGQSERFTLTVTMTATLPAGMDESDIEAQFRAFIEGPGNTRVDWITVDRNEGEVAA